MRNFSCVNSEQPGRVVLPGQGPHNGVSQSYRASSTAVAEPAAGGTQTAAEAVQLLRSCKSHQRLHAAAVRSL